MITRLDWDSDFFGYPVGKAINEEPEHFSIENLGREAEEFRLVYLFSKTELPVSSKDLFLADRKVTLLRKTEMLTDNYECIEPYYGKVTDRLLELALQSGIYSRFNTDRSFVNDEYRKLYTAWIENSVSRMIAREVFVYRRQGRLLGFITSGTRAERADIGLVAVDSQSRGRGIGSLLVSYAVNEARTAGYDEIQVVTQLDNESAMNLYQKNGFCVIDMVYVYHYRRNQAHIKN